MKSKWESVNGKVEIESDENDIPNAGEKAIIKELVFLNTIIIMAIIALGTILSIKVSWYFIFLILIGVPITFLFTTMVVSLVSIACSLEKEETRKRYIKENKKDE